MAQQVKDLVLSLQQLGLLLWRGFDPWPRNFHILQEGERKKKKKECDSTTYQLRSAISTP